MSMTQLTEMVTRPDSNTPEFLEFNRFRLQNVLSSHSSNADAIAGVAAEYISSIHRQQPEHIFGPIKRQEFPEIAKGMTDELEEAFALTKESQRPKFHSGDVYGIFIAYLKDEHADMLRETLETSAVPRAITLTLAHFLLGDIELSSGDAEAVDPNLASVQA